MKLSKFGLLLLAFSIFPVSAAAGLTQCTLTYRIEGWSFVYREYKGNGVVRCRNGQQTNVAIVSRGVGVTIGKSEINHGKGVISDVNSIDEVFGTYVFLDGHAGATKSVEGRVMTKGVVSLALSGHGRGVDFGATIGAFSIKPR